MKRTNQQKVGGANLSKLNTNKLNTIMIYYIFVFDMYANRWKIYSKTHSKEVIMEIFRRLVRSNQFLPFYNKYEVKDSETREVIASFEDKDKAIKYYKLTN